MTFCYHISTIYMEKSRKNSPLLPCLPSSCLHCSLSVTLEKSGMNNSSSLLGGGSLLTRTFRSQSLFVLNSKQINCTSSLVFRTFLNLVCAAASHLPDRLGHRLKCASEGLVHLSLPAAFASITSVVLARLPRVFGLITDSQPCQNSSCQIHVWPEQWDGRETLAGSSVHARHPH